MLTKSEERVNKKVTGPEGINIKKPIKVFAKEATESSSTEGGQVIHSLKKQMKMEDKLLGMNLAPEQQGDPFPKGIRTPDASRLPVDKSRPRDLFPESISISDASH